MRKARARLFCARVIHHLVWELIVKFSASMLFPVALVAAIAGAGLYSLQSGSATGQTQGDAASALIRFSSPTTGSPNAKVHIVEFLDPACEGCKAFYPVVKGVLAEYPGKVRLSVRHLAFHKGADYVVRVLEASRKQNRYWEVLDRLFATQSEWSVNHTARPAQVLASLNGLGLDMQKLQRDMEAPEITQLMAQDLADAKALKVSQTPDFYINGRKLEPFGADELRKMVREQVSAACP